MRSACAFALLVTVAVLNTGCTPEGKGTGSGTGTNEEKEDRKPFGTFAATDVWNEYLSDKQKANKKYTGKYATITGEVRWVREENGKPTVGLNVVGSAAIPVAVLKKMPFKEQDWHATGYPANVVCFIDVEHEKNFADLKRGNSVTIVGKIAGAKFSDEVWKEMRVEIEKCQIIKKN